MTTKPNDGGPAFPCNVGEIKDGQWNAKFHSGATLRDFFAAAALQGDWASQSETNGVGVFPVNTSGATLRNSANLYYRMADAMLAERIQRGE
jgi:hypothetical protein